MVQVVHPLVDRELMRDHDSVTADNGFAVANDAIRLDGGKCQAIAPHGITASATGDLSAVLTAGDELGSCPFLSLGESSGVGEMRVAVEQVLHIFDPYVVADHWCGFDQATVEKNVATWAGDQERSDIAGTHVIYIADDAKWLDGFVPRAPGWIRLGNRARIVSSVEELNNTAGTTGVATQ